MVLWHRLWGSRAPLGGSFTPRPPLPSPVPDSEAGPQSWGLGLCSAPAKAASLALTQGNLNPASAKGSSPWEVPPSGGTLVQGGILRPCPKVG